MKELLLLLLLHYTFLIAGENGCMQNITNKCNFMLKINLLPSSESNWMYHNFFALATCWIWWITNFYTHLLQYRNQKNITSDIFLSCPLQIIICNDQWSPILNPPNVFFTTTPTQKCKVEQTIIYSVENRMCFIWVITAKTYFSN